MGGENVNYFDKLIIVINNGVGFSTSTIVYIVHCIYSIKIRVLVHNNKIEIWVVLIEINCKTVALNNKYDDRIAGRFVVLVLFLAELYWFKA